MGGYPRELSPSARSGWSGGEEGYHGVNVRRRRFSLQLFGRPRPIISPPQFRSSRRWWYAPGRRRSRRQRPWRRLRGRPWPQCRQRLARWRFEAWRRWSLRRRWSQARGSPLRSGQTVRWWPRRQWPPGQRRAQARWALQRWRRRSPRRPGRRPSPVQQERFPAQSRGRRRGRGPPSGVGRHQPRPIEGQADPTTPEPARRGHDRARPRRCADSGQEEAAQGARGRRQ